MGSRSWPYLRFTIALACALVALDSCKTIDRTLEQARIPCGIYRWRIKTLSDAEASSIRWTPIDAEVRELASFSRPAVFDNHRRNANEFYVYRVRAILAAVHQRVDQDLHLLLRDPVDPDSRMVAEIPKPLCAQSSGRAAALAEARQEARALQSRKSEVLVEVTGVGFFDEFHEPKGGAPNGFEIHPVLKLTEIGPGERSYGGQSPRISVSPAVSLRSPEEPGIDDRPSLARLPGIARLKRRRSCPDRLSCRGPTRRSTCL